MGIARILRVRHGRSSILVGEEDSTISGEHIMRSLAERSPGSAPGTMLGVSAAVHGDEIIGTEVLRRLSSRLDGLTIRPGHGGLLVPEPPVPALGGVVEKNRVLGRVYHPVTSGLLETISSPLDSALVILQRETVTRVHPGDYAYMLGDLVTAERAGAALTSP